MSRRGAPLRSDEGSQHLSSKVRVTHQMSPILNTTRSVDPKSPNTLRSMILFFKDIFVHLKTFQSYHGSIFPHDNRQHTKNVSQKSAPSDMWNYQYKVKIGFKTDNWKRRFHQKRPRYMFVEIHFKSTLYPYTREFLTPLSLILLNCWIQYYNFIFKFHVYCPL